MILEQNTNLVTSFAYHNWTCYANFNRYPPLLADIKEILKTFHNPPLMGKPGEEGGLDVCIIPGSQEGITKVRLPPNTDWSQALQIDT